MPAAPTTAEVRRICAIADPELRNLEITQCYSQLAAAVAARSGEGANWCTFATWASRQAGRTIRGEDVLEELQRRLRHRRPLVHPFMTLWRRLLRLGLLRPDTRLGRLVAEVHTPFDAVELAGAAVARGNLKVFEEIGLEFARFLDELPPGSADDAAVERFLAGLTPGDPPDGQLYLRRAFSRYARLQGPIDSATHMRLAVLANLEVGLHEQTRLQPEIRRALDAPYATEEDLGRRVLLALFPDADRLWAVVRRPAAALLGMLAGRIERASRELARELITESFMVLSLPGRVLALGANLDDPYPEALSPPTEAELVELLARFEPAPPAEDLCGVRDWSVLDERMHYIVHLFCAFHLQQDLAKPPFTSEQLAKIARGELPDGEL
jgi:hypothetical protein